ncbi:hypothetical protein SMALA_1530 [Streptomyces malaysiensis subsp. malaysiensis]|nr:hypothetical protein SMALA_1530 [Streptomyces malaysiensis]
MSKKIKAASKPGCDQNSGMSLAGARLLARWCPACRRRESNLLLSHGTGEGRSRHALPATQLGPGLDRARPEPFQTVRTPEDLRPPSQQIHRRNPRPAPHTPDLRRGRRRPRPPTRRRDQLAHQPPQQLDGRHLPKPGQRCKVLPRRIRRLSSRTGP